MMFSHHWSDQKIIAEGAESNTEKWARELLQELEKVLAQMHYIWGDYFEGDNIDVNGKIKKLKIEVPVTFWIHLE